jgi:LemA protein
MKASPWIIIIGIVLLLGGCGGCGYNKMVGLDESVKDKWGAVQTQYQRRLDLIPNLVNTVKGEAKFEQETLTNLVEARAKASSIQLKLDDLSPEKIKQFQDAQGQLSQALGRFLSITENYPNLRANEAFRGLQAQLEGTENRIAVARTDFNSVVKTYNTEVRSFPNNLMASAFGFKQKGYFEAEKNADKAPKVEF